MALNFNEIDLLKNELTSIPITDSQKQSLDKKFRLEFHYNSNHIEGNTLTYSETELLLIFDETRGNHTLREYEEMRSSDVAFEMVKDLAMDKEAQLSELFIKNLNQVLLVRPYWKEAITSEGQNTRRKITVGDYKKQPNSVRLSNGEIFQYASPQDTPILMGEFVDWLKKEIVLSKMHPVELAALVHYRFVCIHPFDDGNGRISRLLMNYVLIFYDFPPIVIKTDDKKNYLSALRDADTGNEESFIYYISRQLVWSLELSIKAANGESLDENQDWKKKLTILKRELVDQEEIKMVKTDTIVLQILNDKLLPLIWSCINDMSGISELFLSGPTVFFKGTLSTWASIRENYIFSLDDVNNVQDYLAISIDFREFNKNGTNAFNVEIVFFVRFEKYKYVIVMDETDIISHFYHQELTNKDIEYFSNECGKTVVDIIEKKIIK